MIGVLGGNGFVGSAFVRFLEAKGLPAVSINRQNYAESQGRSYDVIINAVGNSKKYLSDRNPVEDFDLSVTNILKTLLDFPAGLHVLVSSVDVYNDLTSVETTTEETVLDVKDMSNYGFHKYMAEQCVCHYAPRWLIVRLAGMVGPGLKKNPVYDILHRQPLRIHPDSRYQFMSTASVASAVWQLADGGYTNDVFNLCGRGLISPLEIAALAQETIVFPEVTEAMSPRIVDVDITKATSLLSLPETHASILDYLAEHKIFPSL